MKITVKTILANISPWSYGERGAAVSGAIAAIGTFFNWWLGGFEGMIQALIFFMVMDFALGFVSSLKSKTTNSYVMFWGGVNKFLVLLMVGIGVKLDILLSLDSPYIRTSIIWFFIGRELLSIIENYGKLDMPMPPVMKQVLKQLQENGGDANE